MKHDGGKGDTPRPLGVSMEVFDRNFDLIFGTAKVLKENIKLVNEEFDKAYEQFKKENPDRPAQEGTMLEQTGDGDIQRMDNEK